MSIALFAPLVLPDRFFAQGQMGRRTGGLLETIATVDLDIPLPTSIGMERNLMGMVLRQRVEDFEDALW